MRAGNLRRKITIRRATSSQSESGDYVTTWTTIAQPWAQVEVLNGHESMIGHAVEQVENYRITIRHNASILASDQVKLANGTLLNITSAADPDGLRKFTMIMANSGNATAE